MTVNFEACLGDYKRNEQQVMSKLDNITKQATKGSKGGMQASVAATEEIRTWEEHLWDKEKLCMKFKTDQTNGLTKKDAEALLIEHGKNQLTEKPSTPWYVMLLHEFTGFFSLLLEFGGVLCFVGYSMDQQHMDNLFLGCVLLTVVTVTCLFSYQQSSKAASLMAEFKNFAPPVAQVIRDGKLIPIEAWQLVPGDVIQVTQGENIPADFILFKANEMKVNNASLTGESEDINKTPEEHKANVFESENVAFFGTSCTNGTATGMVFRTGDNTVMGRIAGLASSADTEETTLGRDIKKFIFIISAIAIFLGVSFFILALIMDYEPITAIIFAIGIIVANVPEGLLVTVTVALALTAKRMREKMVQVNNMESVETLGSTSCICSDKTGTLTQNRMSVSQIFIRSEVIDASVNYEIYKKLTSIENNKIGQAIAKKIPEPAYSENDLVFKEFVKTLALGTITEFNYSPSTDEIKRKVATKLKKSVKALPDSVIVDDDSSTAKGDKKKERDSRLPKDPKALQALKDEFDLAEKELQKEELMRPYIKRATKGDASETGIVKFIQPLLAGGENGLWEEGGIEGIRKANPVVMTNGSEVQIPFSSKIKFNMMVRDSNVAVTNPDKARDNMTVYLKGAPERVVGRCSTMLMKIDESGCEEETPINELIQRKIDLANEKFGGSGERVLAFAKKQLDPKVYSKNPTYNFDIKNWQSWQNIKEQPSDMSSGWFPMHGLQLVGLISLNDPPRPMVDISVQRCKKAGIKVIMVTGDQPKTAAAIAHKVNIITDPETEYNYLHDEKGLDWVQAYEQCSSIVIHGDKLAEINREQEAMDDNEIEKGRQVMDWIRVPEVVFARTTPEQKLLIVDACQRLGHVVAVTGDGVNDSPAIKKANIGVAMGSGSQVAKDAADMIILDDDFSSIVNGIEEGRLIFDNLKKSIAYTLTSNIPEICPFIAFILFQVPLPLTTVLILCIDLGTDMVPAIAFAYEHAELDIMERYPRNPKLDVLVGKKMISWSYFQVGMIQQFGAFFTYFHVMNDYGVRPGTLFWLDGEKGYFPKGTDVYDASADNYGNSNKGDDDYFGKMQWLKKSYGDIDLRLFYTARGTDSWSKCRWDDDSSPEFYRISRETGSQICYTTEALKNAHTAYLICIVCLQWADGISAKTRTLSMGQQGLKNFWGNVGFISETLLILLVTYAPFMNLIFETRMVAFPHLGVPVWPWVSTLWLYDEMRKLYVRKGREKQATGQVKLTGWVARNTYY